MLAVRRWIQIIVRDIVVILGGSLSFLASKIPHVASMLAFLSFPGVSYPHLWPLLVPLSYADFVDFSSFSSLRPLYDLISSRLDFFTNSLRPYFFTIPLYDLTSLRSLYELTSLRLDLFTTSLYDLTSLRLDTFLLFLFTSWPLDDSTSSHRQNNWLVSWWPCHIYTLLAKSSNS